MVSKRQIRIVSRMFTTFTTFTVDGLQYETEEDIQKVHVHKDTEEFLSTGDGNGLIYPVGIRAASQEC